MMSEKLPHPRLCQPQIKTPYPIGTKYVCLYNNVVTAKDSRARLEVHTSYAAGTFLFGAPQSSQNELFDWLTKQQMNDPNNAPIPKTNSRCQV